MQDYSAFDHPLVSSMLFHPRPDPGPFAPSENYSEITIPIEESVTIAGKFFTSGPNSATILFFHGNGEIVSDYDELGPLFIQLGINFLPVDYRGYGRSTGQPTVSTMMSDSLIIYRHVKQWLAENGYTGPFIVMGRSLGSASAIEIASNYPDDIDALIIESGFAFAIPLLNLIGINTVSLGITEEQGMRNFEKIKDYFNPTLVIHAQYDHIIPHSDGEALYYNSPAQYKKLITIPEANHNTIFMYGIHEYLRGISELVKQIGTS